MPIQRHATPRGTSVALPAHLANFASHGGQPLAHNVRQRMESYFKASFGDVRVHIGPQASSLGAMAFTRGTDIYFAHGQYNTATPQGQHMLGHELAHVLQQRAGRVRNPFGSVAAVVQDEMLEAEAERMGRGAVQAWSLQRIAAPVRGPILSGTVQRSSTVNIDTSSLISLIKTELSESHPQWQGGKGVVLDMKSEYVNVSKDHKVEVNALGAKYGCHTCNTILASDKDQPWVGDHIPPTNLSSSVLTDLGFKSSTRFLYPHCDKCCELQSALVNALNSGKKSASTLTSAERNLVTTGLATYTGVASSGSSVSQSEGLQVQALGDTHGCHSCGKKAAKEKYHADHCPPKEFYTSYMPQVMKTLGFNEITEFRAKPQCPKCSNAQGGYMNKVTAMAKEYARSIGIKVYS